MHPLDVYSTFQSVKWHFIKKDYDGFKYNFKGASMKMETFETHRDRFTYIKLGERFKSKDELIEYCMANVLKAIKNGDSANLWIRDCNDIAWTEWKTIFESFSYKFEQEMKAVSEDMTFNELLKAKEKEGAAILKLYHEKKLSLETLTCIDIIVPWTKQKLVIGSNPFDLNSDVIQLIDKYRPFVSRRVMNLEKLRKIIIKCFT